MNLNTFTTLIEGLEKRQEQKSRAYDLGIDMLNYDDDYNIDVERPLLLELFSKEGLDWIDWYLYERISCCGETLEAFDKDGEPICFDIPSLYDTIKEYLK
jgi:hypothetical protein